jgi:hypothetical protein
MSMPAPVIALARFERVSDLGAGDSPKAAAAFAVPSAVSVPEATRDASRGGMRFFFGERAGVAMLEVKRFFVDLGEPSELSGWSEV